MMMMMRITTGSSLLLLVLAGLLAVNSAEILYEVSDVGVDGSSCGSAASPCRTFSQLFQNIGASGSTGTDPIRINVNHTTGQSPQFDSFCELEYSGNANRISFYGIIAISWYQPPLLMCNSMTLKAGLQVKSLQTSVEFFNLDFNELPEGIVKFDTAMVSGELLLSNIKIQSFFGFGTLFVVPNGNITILNSFFLYIQIRRDGPSLFRGSKALMIEGSTFIDCDGPSDGAIFLDSAEVEILSSSFSGCDSFSGTTGVLRVSDWSNIRITNSIFENNRANSDGGVVYLGAHSTITSISNKFESNEAEGSGGVFFVGEGSTINELGSEYLANSATNGGCYFQAGNSVAFNVNDTLFHDNNARDGAIIYSVRSGFTMSFTYSNVTSSSSTRGSFAYLAFAASPNSILITNSRFEGLQSNDGFSFMFGQWLSLIVEDSIFSNIRTASNNIYLTRQSDFIFRRCQFFGMTASYEGSVASLNDNSRLEFENCYFAQVSVERSAFLLLANSPKLYIRNCDFNDSTIENSGNIRVGFISFQNVVNGLVDVVNASWSLFTCIRSSSDESIIRNTGCIIHSEGDNNEVLFQNIYLSYFDSFGLQFFYLKDVSNLILNNLSILESAGRFLYANNAAKVNTGSIQLQNLNFNSLTHLSEVIYIVGVLNINIEDCNFESIRGSSLSLEANNNPSTQGFWRISRCRFSGGNVLQNGKEILAFQESTKLSPRIGAAAINIVFADRPAVNRQKYVIENCIFENNVGQFGGAILWENSFTDSISELKVSFCVFRSNTALEDGGAIFRTRTSVVTIENSVFEKNNALHRGGAIFSAMYPTPSPDELSDGFISSYKNVTFTENHSKNGGAIFEGFFLSKFEEVSFISNEVEGTGVCGDSVGAGGAIYINWLTCSKISSNTFTDVSFEGNIAERYAAGIGFGVALDYFQSLNGLKIPCPQLTVEEILSWFSYDDTNMVRNGYGEIVASQPKRFDYSEGVKRFYMKDGFDISVIYYDYFGYVVENDKCYISIVVLNSSYLGPNNDHTGLLSILDPYPPYLFDITAVNRFNIKFAFTLIEDYVKIEYPTEAWIGISLSLDPSVHASFLPRGTPILDGMITARLVLELCVPGEVLVRSGPTTVYTCRACVAGKFVAHTECCAECFQCPNGTYAPLRSTTCYDCPAGKFGQYLPTDICEVCTLGEYGPEPRAMGCSPCAEGSYADTPAQSTCEFCISNSKTYQPGAFSIYQCHCPRQYYGSPWANISCNECPKLKGVICEDNSTIPYVRDGYFRMMTQLPDGSVQVGRVLECFPRFACQLAGFGNTTCQVGYQGHLCGECASGYYFMDNVCRPCIAPYLLWFILGIFCVVFLFFIHRYTSTMESGMRLDVRLGLLWLQFTAMFSKISFEWPPAIQGIFRFSKFLNFDFTLFAPTCGAPLSFWMIYYIGMGAPLFFFICGTLLTFGVIHYKSFRGIAFSESDFSTFYTRSVSIVVFLVITMYTSAASVVLQPLRCYKQNDGSTTLLPAPYMTCYDDVWNRNLYIFGTLILIVLFGIPIWLIYTLYRFRKDINDIDFVCKYRALVEPYHHSFFYWEIINMLKKVILVTILDFFPNVISFTRTFLAVITIFLFVVFENIVQPYRTKNLNHINVLWGIVSIAFLLANGLIFLPGSFGTEYLDEAVSVAVDKSSRDMYGWILVLAFAIAVIFSFWNIISAFLFGAKIRRSAFSGLFWSDMNNRARKSDDDLNPSERDGEVELSNESIKAAAFDNAGLTDSGVVDTSTEISTAPVAIGKSTDSDQGIAGVESNMGTIKEEDIVDGSQMKENSGSASSVQNSNDIQDK